MQKTINVPLSDAIDLRGITKAYGDFYAVKNVSLVVKAGEIHSLVGANGAGKSTLLGMLSGRTSQTMGEIRVMGEVLPGGNPRAAKSAGVSIVYQELTILPALSAVANLFLGNELSMNGWLDEHAMLERYKHICEELDVHIPSHVLGRDMTVASQQMLEIMRAVEQRAKILILDEPTAALSFKERSILLGLVKQLRSRGVTIVLVTHNLDEVLEVSDTVTVLREGQVVSQAPVGAWTKESLVEHMTGAVSMHVEHKRRVNLDTEALLSVDGVFVPGVTEPMSFEVRVGEVLGIAGLVGAGRTTLLRCLAGAEPKAQGRMKIGGTWRPLPKSPKSAIDQGIALLPENRKTEGLVLGMSISDNVTLPNLPAVSKCGLVSRKKQCYAATRLLGRFTFKKSVEGSPVKTLSGGNQQKVVFSKILQISPTLMLIDEPTRGIDVPAKAELLRALRLYAEQGSRAVIMTSTELEEVIEVSDRIIVLKNGRYAGELDNSTGMVVPQDILKMAFGVSKNITNSTEGAKSE